MPVTGNGHPGRRVQYAALPYRVRSDGEVQVRLITSRETRRWVIPKGWPIKGLSPAKTAAREAYEEAGLMGTIARDAVGIYTYEKNLGIRSVLCDVMVFPLKVKRHLHKWPERSQRYGFWFSIDTAAAAVQEEDLKGLILSFGDFMAVRLAAKREAEAAAAAKKKDVKPASKSANTSAARQALATALLAAPPAEGGGGKRAAKLSRRGAQRHRAEQPGVSEEPLAAVSSTADASKAAGRAEPRGMHPATPEEVGPDLSKLDAKSKKAQGKAKKAPSKAPSKAKAGAPVEAETPAAARDASGVEPPDPVASTSSTAKSGTTARTAAPVRKRPVTKPVPAAKAGAAPVAKAAVSRAVKSSPKPASRAAAQLAAGPAKTAVRADKGVKATLPLAGLRAEQESAPVPEGGLPVAKKLPKKVIAKGKRTSALAKAPRAEGPSQPSGRGRGGKR